MRRFGQLLETSFMLYWRPLVERPAKFFRLCFFPLFLLFLFTGLMFIVFSVTASANSAGDVQDPTWPSDSMSKRNLKDTCYYGDGKEKYPTCLGLVFDKDDPQSVTIMESVIDAVALGNADQVMYFDDVQFVEDNILKWIGYTEPPCKTCILPTEFGYFLMLTHSVDAETGELLYDWQLAMQNTETFETIQNPSSPKTLFDLTRGEEKELTSVEFTPVDQTMAMTLYSYFENLVLSVLKGAEKSGTNPELNPIKSVISASMGSHSPYGDMDDNPNNDLTEAMVSTTIFPFTFSVVFSLMISMMSVNSILSTSSSITRCVCQAGMHPLAMFVAAFTVIMLVIAVTTLSSFVMWGIFPGTFSTLYQNSSFTCDVGVYLVAITALGFLVQTSTFGVFFTRKVIANVMALLIAIFAPVIMTIMGIQPYSVPYYFVMIFFPCSFGTTIPSSIINFKNLAMASSNSKDGVPAIITETTTRFSYFDIIDLRFPKSYLIQSVVDDTSRQERAAITALPGLLLGSFFVIVMWFFFMYVGIAVRPKELGGSGNYNWRSIFQRMPRGKYLKQNSEKYFGSDSKSDSPRGTNFVETSDSNGTLLSQQNIHKSVSKQMGRNKEGRRLIDTKTSSSTVPGIGEGTSTFTRLATDASTLGDGDMIIESPPQQSVVCSIHNVYKFYKTKVNKNDPDSMKSKRLVKDEKGKTKFAAVNGISNDFIEGSITGLIGVNGAGKTTLMSMMLGLSRPTRGAIAIFGNSVYEDKASRQLAQRDKHRAVTHTSTLEYLPLIGFVPQHNIVGNFSCQLHCEIMASIRGVPGGKEGRKREAIRCLELMGLIQDGKQFSRGVDLSGGQQRRLMVAMALVGKPPLLILDEPSAGLTIDAKQLLDSSLRTIAAEQHSSIIITEHDLTQVDGLVDEMVIVREGTIVAKGTSLTLKEEYGEGYTLRVSYEDTIEKEGIGAISPDTGLSREEQMMVFGGEGDRGPEAVDPVSMERIDEEFATGNPINNGENGLTVDNNRQTRAQLLEKKRQSKKLSFKGNENVIDLLATKTLKICRLYDQTAHIKYKSGRDVFFTLPGYEVAEHLYDLGNSLTELRSKLHIGSFAFDIATLSDVFIRLANENVKSRTMRHLEATSVAASTVNSSSDDGRLVARAKYVDKHNDDSTSDSHYSSGRLSNTVKNGESSGSRADQISDIIMSNEVDECCSSTSDVDPRIKPLVHKQTRYIDTLKLLVWKSFLGVVKYHAIFYKMIFDISLFMIVMITFIIILPFISELIDSLSKPESITNDIDDRMQYNNVMGMLTDSSAVFWSATADTSFSENKQNMIISALEKRMEEFTGVAGQELVQVDYSEVEGIINDPTNLETYIPLVGSTSSPFFNSDVVYYSQLLPTVIVFGTEDEMTLYLSPEYYTLGQWSGKLNNVSSSQGESFSRIVNRIVLDQLFEFDETDTTQISSSLRMFSASPLTISFPLTAVISAFYALVLQLTCGYTSNVLPYIFSMERCNGFCQLLRMNGENNNKENRKYANITSWLIGIALPYATSVSVLSYAFTLTPAYLMRTTGSDVDKQFIPTYSFLISLGIFFNSLTWSSFTMWISYKYSDCENTLKMMPFFQWLMNGAAIIEALVILIVTSTVNAGGLPYSEAISTVMATYDGMLIFFVIYPFAFAIPFTADLIIRCHSPDIFNLYDSYTGINQNSGSNRYTFVSIAIVFQVIWFTIAVSLLFSREAVEAVGTQSRLMRETEKDTRANRAKRRMKTIIRTIVVLGTRRTSDPMSPSDKLKKKLYKVEMEELSRRRKKRISKKMMQLQVSDGTVSTTTATITPNSSFPSEDLSNNSDLVVGLDGARNEVDPMSGCTVEDFEDGGNENINERGASEWYIREPMIRHPCEDETVAEERRVADELAKVMRGQMALDEADVDPADFVIIINKCRREFVTQGEVRTEPGADTPKKPGRIVNVAVRDVSLTCRKGECLGIVGENGCGKSVMLSLLLGQMSTSRGQALVTYKSKGSEEAEMPRIGYVPQINVYHECLTVRQHIKLFSLLGGIKPEDGMDIASFCGLGSDDLLNNFPQRLSGGYKRRLNLAIALITSTEILIADEVAAGVDEHARLAIIEIIDTLKSSGCSIILTSQAMDTVERLADRVAVMTKGRLRTVNSPDKIKQRLGDGNIITLQIAEGHVEDAKQWLADTTKTNITDIGILPTLGGDYRFIVPLGCSILKILDVLSPAKRPPYIMRGVVAPPSLQSVFIRLEQETERLKLSCNFIK